jgi:hypothetical protein
MAPRHRRASLAARAQQEPLSVGTTDEYEWRKALEDAAPVDPGSAEFAARADVLAGAIPPDQRGIDLHPDVDPEHKQWTHELLAAAISRGEWRYTYSGDLIEGGAEPDLAKMRRPHPLYWPIGYRCGRGHRSFVGGTSERPHNSGIYHGYCEQCGGDVWAYAEWDEPVPEHLPFHRLLPLAAPPH